MLASFMVIIAGLRKTSFIAKFQNVVVQMANKGGFKAYVMMVLVVMLGTSLFGTGSTAWYVMVIGLLSTIPSSDNLPATKFIMPASFACNHPLIPVNTALQFGYVLAVLEAGGAVIQSVSLPKFAVANFILSAAFFAWCVFAYKLLPSRAVEGAETSSTAKTAAVETQLTKTQEMITYICFVLGIAGMIAQSFIGDQGYALCAVSASILLFAGVLNFNEVRNEMGAPIILMSAGVIGVAEAMGVTGLTALVGETVAGMLGSNVNVFILIFVFCVLTSVLATLTGSTIGTVLIR